LFNVIDAKILIRGKKLGTVLGILFCTLTMQPFSAHSDTLISDAQAADPLVLIVGDSISAGLGVPVEEQWPLILENELRKEFPQLTVVAAATSGDTTSGGLTRLPALLKQHNPNVVILALGGNDALRGTQLGLVKQNLERMTYITQNSGAAVVLAGMQIPPNYGPAYTERFRAIYPQVAEKYRAAIIPFLLEGVAAVEGMMQDDGIHPTSKAQPTISKLVYNSVHPLLNQ
jgi:acyl-CoA thioesterase-1